MRLSNIEAALNFRNGLAEATLRVPGARFWSPQPQGQLLQQLVQVLCDRHLLKVWTDTVYEHLPKQPHVNDPALYT